MIEIMNDNDIEEVIALEHELFTLPWKVEDFLYEVNVNPYGSYFVYRVAGKIVGYCGVWCLFEQAQVTTIGVTQKFQRKKIASTLMQHMIDYAIVQGCETLSLEVRVSNASAIAMYERFGFETINIRKAYYSDNHEDAYLMMKAIGGWPNE